MKRQDQQQHTDSHPTAHPFTSTSKSLITSVDTALGALNDGAHAGTTPAKPRRKQRMHPRDVQELASWLSERDIAVLRSVAAHQFLTVRQIEALHFAEHTPLSGARIARRILERLRYYRLLGTLQRRIGGVTAGSTGLIHYVDTVGDQLLRGRSGRQARRRSREPSSRFLNHRLAIADAHVALVSADRQRQLELIECAIEPASWRRFTGIGGARLTLKPDLTVEVSVAPGSEYAHAWFIEIDLGTEGIQTLLKKCREYEAYRRSGVEQEANGTFPVVIWSVTHPNPVKAENRRQALQEAIAADRTLPRQLFRVIAPQQLIPALTAGAEQ